MPASNVEVFAEAGDALARGDIVRLEQLTDSEIEFIPRRAPVQGSYSGHEGIRRFVRDNQETFDLVEWHAEDVRDVGQDRVLGLGKMKVRGKGSGAEVEFPAAIVATFRNGRVVHFKDYLDREKALEAVGLTE